MLIGVATVTSVTGSQRRNPLPLVGVLVSLALFTWAAALYPGGYDWARHFISTLFAPSTASGSSNPARYLAVLAMFSLCVSLAVLFKVVSERAKARAHQKTLEIGGIGAAVYAFLIVTPMHNLLIGIALLFYVPATVAALQLARLEGRKALFGTGVVCLGLVIATAAMYYERWFWSLLPLAQKISLTACVVWLLALQLAPGRWGGADGSPEA